jgi:hypothetical protein
MPLKEIEAQNLTHGNAAEQELNLSGMRMRRKLQRGCEGGCDEGARCTTVRCYMRNLPVLSAPIGRTERRPSLELRVVYTPFRDSHATSLHIPARFIPPAEKERSPSHSAGEHRGPAFWVTPSVGIHSRRASPVLGVMLSSGTAPDRLTKQAYPISADRQVSKSPRPTFQKAVQACGSNSSAIIAPCRTRSVLAD